MELLTQYKFVDLTHEIDDNIPVWPGSRKFSKKLIVDYPQGIRIYDYHMCEGLGTHMDAPSHFIKDARSIHEFSLEELIAPLCVIDVRAKVKNNPDYVINVDDIKQWEKINGNLPARAVVAGFTGWSQYWPDEARYQNRGKDNLLHFPGFSKEAAEYLVQKNVGGVGIDTLSIDAGIATGYPAHFIILGAGKFQIENLANLDQVSAAGAIIMVLPLKVKDGPEASARVIALIKK